jgi:hypothetical protein
LGDSLVDVLNTTGGNSALCSSLKVRDANPTKQFVDNVLFQESLPIASDGMKVTVETAQRDVRLFGVGLSVPAIRISIPLNFQNRGFDIIVGRSDPAADTSNKRVLLIQCKTKVMFTGENSDAGQTFNS